MENPPGPPPCSFQPNPAYSIEYPPTTERDTHTEDIDVSLQEDVPSVTAGCTGPNRMHPPDDTEQYVIMDIDSETSDSAPRAPGGESDNPVYLTVVDDPVDAECSPNPSYAISNLLRENNSSEISYRRRSKNNTDVTDYIQNPSYRITTHNIRGGNNNDPVVPVLVPTQNEPKFTTDTQTTENVQTSTCTLQEELYEDMDGLPPDEPPSYEYVLSEQSRHSNNPAYQVITDSENGNPRTNPNNPKSENVYAHVNLRVRRYGGEYYRLSLVLLVLSLIVLQIPALICVIPALALSVKAKKLKSRGDLENARRFDKYSLVFVVISLVYLISIYVFIALAPFLGGVGFIIWLLVCLCNFCSG